MTLTVDDDFARFVAARWGDLEPVAHLVTLDASVARRITTQALADLHVAWEDVVDHGSPTGAARRAVLTAAVGAATGHRVPVRHEASLPGDQPGWAQPALDAEVLAALAPVIVDASPLERSDLAASVVWGLEADETAALLGMPAAPLLAAESSLRARLSTAHTAARAAAGSPPAEWALDRDVEDAVGLLLLGRDDPPDPTELVVERRRQVRRRSLVAGGAATLAVGAVAALAGRSVLRGAAAGAPVRPPGPGDPVWRSTGTWPARGRLAADRGVAAVVGSAAPSSRLLFAEDLPGRRVAVAAVAEPSGLGTTVRMWTGPEGARPDALAEASLVRDRITFLVDVVPVVVPAPARAGLPELLLLSRPHVLTAEYSTRVSYAPTGEVARSWTEVPLRDGIARLPLTDPVPPALRVRIGSYEGGALGTTPLGLGPPDPAAPLAESLVAAVGPFVAACTGLAPSALRSRVALEASVPGDVFVPTHGNTAARDGRAAVVLTHLPNGAVLRSVRVAGDGRAEQGPADVETARSIPVHDEEAPFAVRLPWFRATTGRFLVLAPGAARAQLTAIASNVYPTSPVTPLVDGTGVLEVVDARLASIYRLVLWSRSGRRLGAWRQVFRRGDPRDLWTPPR